MSGQRGFALPFTVFLVAVVTLLLTAAFVRVEADRRVADSSGAAVSAMTIAQGGLQRYLGDTATGTPNPTSLCPPGRPRGAPPDLDSVRVNVAGGYADIVTHLLRQPADTLDPRLYLIRSTGRLVEPSEGADPQANRTVAQYALWQTGAIDQVAAFTAASGLTRVNGTSPVNIRGNDHYTPQMPSKYGLRAPAGLVTIGSGPGVIDGTGSTPSMIVQDSASQVAAWTNVDWPAIVNGGLVPDYTSFVNHEYNYATQIIQGNFTTPIQINDGTGLLIVTGDLTIRGPLFIWHGIVLVGGALRDSTAGPWGAYFVGALATGLNAQLGATPPRSVVGTGATTNGFNARYNSCDVRSTLAQLTGFVPLSNAWVDNWTTY